MSLSYPIFAVKFSDMKNQSVKENTAELKKEIKKKITYNKVNISF